MSGRLHINVDILNAGVFGGSWRFPGTDGQASYAIDHYTSIATSSVQGRPVVVAADPDVLGWAAAARSAGASAHTLADVLAGWIDDVLAAVRTLVPLLSASTGPTLRASLGLRDTVETLS
ncbi:hypothetical protein P3H15_41850 [Rhodococcus sp. T2V]|uniref:hypothetical protein n=1 Tax=Rhodococcus sp. T2V TaxID=3034164 RepID=UPI0023E16E8A|nr:hypothetical protein [Rhodococcus sp. T2V]MDF3311532.1 hypothetical protein [Rhodococcus sp. T2V]